eukprot:scaffold6938_cov48-Phaeocystis_antarctica.AAC.2
MSSRPRHTRAAPRPQSSAAAGSARRRLSSYRRSWVVEGGEMGHLGGGSLEHLGQWLGAQWARPLPGSAELPGAARRPEEAQEPSWGGLPRGAL